MASTRIGTKVLVPLDGSTAVRAALGPAAEVVAASGGELVLLTVVTHGFERMIDGFVEAEHVTAEAAASQYLYRVEQDLVGELDDVRISQIVRSGDDPADIILDVASSTGSTLIALTSHGYTGFRKLVLGSVTETILKRSTIPVLLVPLDEST